MMKVKKHKLRNRILIAILAIVLAMGIGMGYWINDTYKPNEEAKTALVSNTEVEVIVSDEIVFRPQGITPTKGLIFYPGGLVEPEAYAGLCQKIAKEGYLVVIKPMTLNLAVLSPNKADEVIKNHPEITTWAIGGHSLGGVMASDYAMDHESIKGIVFYASYPRKSMIEQTRIKVLSLYGTEDGVADLEKIKTAKIPKGSMTIDIPGGNHAGFGSYGKQKGDHDAAISGEEQQTIAAKETVEFLKQL